MTSDSNKQPQPDTPIDFAALTEQLRPVVEAYAGMTESEVARMVWRKQMIAAGVCADCAAAGQGPMINTLDKVGAFLDKAASGFVQLNGALKDFAAEDSPHSAQRRAPDNDPLAHAIETWSRAG